MGLKAIPEAEESAVELFDLLDAEQHKVALQKEQFKEIPQAVTKPDVALPSAWPRRR